MTLLTHAKQGAFSVPASLDLSRFVGLKTRGMWLCNFEQTPPGLPYELAWKTLSHLKHLYLTEQ
jgi:hypothetical protein